jgi:hypothetical protein
MNLITLIFSIQTLLVVIVALVLTQVSKLGIELALATESPDPLTAKRSGNDMRKLRPVITHILLPALPVAFGFLFGLVAGALQPMPGLEGAGSHALWGALAGVLGEYGYSRVHGLRSAVRNNRAG